MPILTQPNSDGVPLRENQKKLAQKYGIEQFAFPSPESSIRSIGFNPKTSTWYGWSHRAIAGFKVGDVVKKGDVIANPDGWPPLRNQKVYTPGHRITSLQDARDAAASFSEWVS